MANDRFNLFYCHNTPLFYFRINFGKTGLDSPVWVLKVMERVILALTSSFVFFGRNLIGCINAPYVTYRRLSNPKADLIQTIFIPILVIFYFIFVATIRNGIQNPYLLTVKFNLLFFASAGGFLFMLCLFYLAGKLVGGKGSLRQIYTLWIFSLIPTLVWFFITSTLYLMLPPPRTISFWGKLYSVVFIAFSIAVLLWKVMLYYLTLRFSLKIDLYKITIVSTVVIPTIIIYSLLMYRWGIFRIPFL